MFCQKTKFRLKNPLSKNFFCFVNSSDCTRLQPECATSTTLAHSGGRPKLFLHIWKNAIFQTKKIPLQLLERTDILPKDSYFKDSYTFFEHVWKNWWFSVLKTFLWLPRSQFLLISYTCGITLQLFMLANKLLIFLINLNSLQI